MRKTRRACGPLFWVEALAVALMAFTATSAMALTVVEKRLAALRPCSHLKMPQKMLGVTVAIGIDTLKAVALDRGAAVLRVGDGGAAAGVDEALHLVGFCRPQEVERAIDVGRV